MQTTHPHRKRHIFYILLFFLAAGLLAARMMLNGWVKDYVNGVLDHIPGYTGSIEDVDIDLYRGAYRVHALKVFKTSGHIPAPFIDIEVVDLSVEWKALLHGRVVAFADLTKPVLNFAVNREGTAEQTGAGVDWTKPIKALMPIDINHVTFHDGKLTWLDFSTHPQVDIYIHRMSGEAYNLRNVVDAEKELPSRLMVQGDSIGKGKLHIDGRLNILKQVPDMALDMKLEQVSLPALSDYSNAYASVDIRQGTLNVYSEVTMKDGHLTGYIKPIATQVALIDLRKETNPVKLAWEVLVSLVVEIFTNQPHDQFATKIPLEGNLNDIKSDTLVALGGIIRNAFVAAFKKGFDHTASLMPQHKIQRTDAVLPVPGDADRFIVIGHQ